MSYEDSQQSFVRITAELLPFSSINMQYWLLLINIYSHHAHSGCIFGYSEQLGGSLRALCVLFFKFSCTACSTGWPSSPFHDIMLDRAGIFKQSMGARHRVGIGLSYRPAMLHRLAEFIPWDRFLGSINV